MGVGEGSELLDLSGPVIKSSLGRFIELGTLCDLRTGEIFNGNSLWFSSEVEKYQKVKNIGTCKFQYCSSLDELRKHSGIDAEGSLGVDFGLFQLSGDAKYLESKATNSCEARVNVSCVSKKQTRWVPMELISQMRFENKLDDPRFTHFVSEVVEGAAASISFSKECSSSEEQQHISGSLSGAIRALVTMKGEISMDWKKGDGAQHDQVRIEVSGAIQEAVGSFEDVARLGRQLPEKLKDFENTLEVTFQPISLLDSRVRRIVRQLDEETIAQLSKALKAAEAANVELEISAAAKILSFFPKIKKQIDEFSNRFLQCVHEFRTTVRNILPKLKDGATANQEGDLLMSELRNSMEKTRRRTIIATKYADKKRQESMVLDHVVQELLRHGFANFLDTPQQIPQVIGATKPRVVLSISGGKIGVCPHPMLRQLFEDATSESATDDDEEDDDSFEWFEEPSTLAYLQSSSAAILKLKANNDAADFDAEYGVVAIDKGIHPDEKRRRTVIGDVLYIANGNIRVITTHLPTPPRDISLFGNKQDIRVKWIQPTNAVLPTRRFIVRWRPRPNQALDSFDQAVGDDELFDEMQCDGGGDTVFLSNLRSATDYEVVVKTITDVGHSVSSISKVLRTEKKPSAASALINFYKENEYKLRCSASDFGVDEKKPWEVLDGKKPWELTSHTLFLGYQTAAIRHCKGTHGKETAVLIADVVPEFRPEISHSSQEDALVLMFVGKTGSGKTTEVNAFISYLLGGDLTDSHRLLLIDDRKMDHQQSVTKYITVYRIRPLSDAFQGKTLYVIDTPGYCDTKGNDRDRFITMAMSELFQTITHVNAVVLTCAANEPRATPDLTAVVTYISQLFSKDVQSCLRTILTHGDAGISTAIPTLDRLGWPTSNGVIKVNNSAFRIAGRDNSDDPSVRDWWAMSMSGQKEVLKKLLYMPAVPIDKSAQVTSDRMNLEQKCDLAEKKIYRTAQETQNLLSNMRALADTIGAAPGETVAVTIQDVIQQDIPEGKHTTLCRTCNSTCHEICTLDDNDGKRHCIAMNGDGNCKMCPKKCSFSVHCNARFILKPVSRIEHMVPEDLIKKWNEGTNTCEGALLNIMDIYLEMQDQLQEEIHELVELTEKLQRTALLHSPGALLNYLNMLIDTARARGASPEQLQSLNSARNTMLIAQRVRSEGSSSSKEAKLLSNVVEEVRNELVRRNQMNHRQRAKEEEKPCYIYNELRQKIPDELLNKVPKPFSEKSSLFQAFQQPAKFPENLKAIVKLIDVILQTGKVLTNRTQD